MRTKNKILPYAIRPMKWDDLSQVANMEREAFPTLWPGTSYQREMKNKFAEYVVCEHAHERISLPSKKNKGRLFDIFRKRPSNPPEFLEMPLLVGYMGLWYMAGEAHIVSIAVKNDFQKIGLGELLMISAFEMALRHDSEVLTLEVRVSNNVAISLYKKFGLKEVGLRRGYYSDNHEDAHIMSTDSLRSEKVLDNFKSIVDAFEKNKGETERKYLE